MFVLAVLCVCVAGSGVLVTSLADRSDTYAVRAVNVSGAVLPYCADSDFQSGNVLALDPVSRMAYWANWQKKLLFRAHVSSDGFVCGASQSVCIMLSWFQNDELLIKMWVDNALGLLIFVHSMASTSEVPCGGAEDCLVVRTVPFADCNNPAHPPRVVASLPSATPDLQWSTLSYDPANHQVFYTQANSITVSPPLDERLVVVDVAAAAVTSYPLFQVTDCGFINEADGIFYAVQSPPLRRAAGRHPLQQGLVYDYLHQNASYPSWFSIPASVSAEGSFSSVVLNFETSQLMIVDASVDKVQSPKVFATIPLTPGGKVNVLDISASVLDNGATVYSYFDPVVPQPKRVRLYEPGARLPEQWHDRVMSHILARPKVRRVDDLRHLVDSDKEWIELRKHLAL